MKIIDHRQIILLIQVFSYFFLLIPVFVLTDYLRYKPVLCVEGLSYMVTWVLLLWARGIPAMQVMQVVYGVALSTEVAYYTYIYSQVSLLSTFNLNFWPKMKQWYSH